MTARTPAENKAIVLEGFETLFNRKDRADERGRRLRRP